MSVPSNKVPETINAASLGKMLVKVTRVMARSNGNWRGKDEEAELYDFEYLLPIMFLLPYEAGPFLGITGNVVQEG